MKSYMQSNTVILVKSKRVDWRVSMDFRRSPFLAIPVEYVAATLCHLRYHPLRPDMRYLSIYLAALSSLSSSRGLRPGSSQIRDLVAFPKYEIQFLNDLPLAASDANRCQTFGIERELEFLDRRVTLADRRRLSDGTDGPSQVSCLRYAEANT